MVLKVLKDFREIKVLKVLKVLKDFREIKVSKV
jgi:hypothetical protein